MKSYKTIAMIIMMALVYTMSLGCYGRRVEVPPAHVGKILGTTGYHPETISPSIFRLTPCWRPGSVCDKLILLEASDVGFEEEMTILMPGERLNVTLDIRGVASISGNKKNTDPIFEKIVAGEDRLITISEVYATYVRSPIRGVTRNVTTEQESIEWLLNNREEFAQALFKSIRDRLVETGSPISVSRLELSDLQPPKKITESYEKAAQREAEIREQEQIAAKAMIKAGQDLELSKAKRLIRKENALALAEENRITSKGLNPMLLEYRRLDALETIAESGSTIFLPMNMGGANGSLVNAELIRSRLASK